MLLSSALEVQPPAARSDRREQTARAVADEEENRVAGGSSSIFSRASQPIFRDPSMESITTMRQGRQCWGSDRRDAQGRNLVDGNFRARLLSFSLTRRSSQRR